MPSNFSDDVDEETKAVVNHAVYVRGTIISSYAHIEFLLADICLKGLFSVWLRRHTGIEMQKPASC